MMEREGSGGRREPVLVAPPSECSSQQSKVVINSDIYIDRGYYFNLTI
jgi:hypothetical protein